MVPAKMCLYGWIAVTIVISTEYSVLRTVSSTLQLGVACLIHDVPWDGKGQQVPAPLMVCQRADLQDSV